MVVRVDQMRARVRMSRQMDLPDAVDRHAGDVIERRKAVIDRVYVDIVHVEQDAAVGALGDSGQELPFGHRGVLVGQVARNILDQNAPAQPLLHVADSRRGRGHRFFGERQREQIVRVMPSERAPAKMVGDPRGLEAADQRQQVVEVALADRIDAADIERNAMQDDRSGRPCALENLQRPPAADHEVLGDYLEPVGARGAVENSCEVRGAQADAMTQMGKVTHRR